MADLCIVLSPVRIRSQAPKSSGGARLDWGGEHHGFLPLYMEYEKAVADFPDATIYVLAVEGREEVSASPKAAIFAISKSPKAARKLSRLRKIVSHDRPA